jgi:hypothetical protein
MPPAAPWLQGNKRGYPHRDFHYGAGQGAQGRPAGTRVCRRTRSLSGQSDDGLPERPGFAWLRLTGLRGFGQCAPSAVA